MKILALDLSTTSTGYAIFTDGELESSGTIAPKKNLKAEERIKNILGIIEKHLKEECPDVVVSEAPILYGGRPNGIFSLGNLHGGLLLLCSQHGISLEPINNKTWKKHIAGGSATKEKTQEYLKRLYNYNTDTFDQSDAIGIGLGFISEEKFKTTIAKIEPKRPVLRKRNKKTIKHTTKHKGMLKNDFRRDFEGQMIF